MIRCKNCKNINIEVNLLKDDNLEFFKKEFHCLLCHDVWFSDPEAQKLHLEYKELVPKTSVVSEIVRPQGTYHVYHIKPEELNRRIELAKILTENHQHDLDLEAGEWFEIIQDAK